MFIGLGIGCAVAVVGFCLSFFKWDICAIGSIMAGLGLGLLAFGLTYLPIALMA